MAYKKYIKKNGKIYGPYVYHSKRIDGKVISEYRGMKPEKQYRKIFIISISIIILAILLAGMIFFGKQFTGKVIINLDPTYKEGHILEGNLNLELKEGELIPANSKIIFNNNGKDYEYPISDFIQSESKEGNHYVENIKLNDSGQGYGFIGKIEESPTIFFKFKIIGEETDSESIPELPTEETTKEIIPEEISIEFEENLAEETDTESEIIIEPELISEPSTEETDTESEQIETISEPESTPKPPTEKTIPEEIISGISNLFLSLTATGKVTNENEIQGDVAFGKEYTYNLKEGETIKIIPSSIKTELEELNENVLEISTEKNIVTITTNYKIEKEGFGESYLGETKEIEFDLTKLGLELTPGELITEIVYEETVIISTKTILEEKIAENLPEPISNEIPIEENISEINSNETNQTNITIEQQIPEFNLTAEEISILQNSFGTIDVNQNTKSFKDRIIVEFSIGIYSVEYTYDSSLSENKLKELIERDKINWLKDIAYQKSQTKTSYKSIPNF
jgi:hypothetical protein